MNKLLLAGVGVLILGGGLFFYISFMNNNGVDNSISRSATPTSVVDNNETQLAEVGNYLAYNPQLFQEKSDMRRVLFFYANWCPTCRPADQEFSQNESMIPDDVMVLRVNYNDDDTDAQEEALANEYGVTYQHTFVQVDENGNEVSKWNGGGMEELLENIE